MNVFEIIKSNPCGKLHSLLHTKPHKVRTKAVLDTNLLVSVVGMIRLFTIYTGPEVIGPF